jgi:hypothetical protein
LVKHEFTVQLLHTLTFTDRYDVSKIPGVQSSTLDTDIEPSWRAQQEKENEQYERALDLRSEIHTFLQRCTSEEAVKTHRCTFPEPMCERAPSGRLRGQILHMLQTLDHVYACAQGWDVCARQWRVVIARRDRIDRVALEELAACLLELEAGMAARRLVLKDVWWQRRRAHKWRRMARESCTYAQVCVSVSPSEC